jgi:hypothetical protein
MSVFSKIGKFVGNAPKKAVKGAGRLVTNPGKAIKNIGKSAGQAWEAVDDVALPALGFAVGGPMGAALGGGLSRGIGDGKFNLGATLKRAALTGAAGAGVSALGGPGAALGKLGRIGGKVGGAVLSGGGKLLKGAGSLAANTAKNAFMSDGGLDLGKLGSLFGAGSAIVGNRRDNANAQSFNDSNAKLRQMLMERILEKPNYNFQ